MSPTLIFEILFLVGAAIGLGAHLAGRPWGVPLALAGLIFFDIVLMITGAR